MRGRRRGVEETAEGIAYVRQGRGVEGQISLIEPGLVKASGVLQLALFQRSWRFSHSSVLRTI